MRHDRSPLYRLPAELILVHVKRYLAMPEHSHDDFMEDAGLTPGQLRDLLSGKTTTIGFNRADKILCVIDEVGQWYTEPLLSHYDRILTVPDVVDRERASRRESMRKHRAKQKAAA